nr:unnamed protein product [Callosobruchus analis]
MKLYVWTLHIMPSVVTLKSTGWSMLFISTANCVEKHQPASRHVV